jgi:hypothetical protein
MDIAGLITQMSTEGAFARVINNPLAQFGPPTQPFLGATLLPDRMVPENSYTEEGVKYRSVIANAATRYSPVQKKGGALVGTVDVKLRDSDIGSELKAQEYDAVIRLVERAAAAGAGVNRPTMEAVAQLTRWAINTLSRPLAILDEKNRWDAIVDASVTRTGDNGYTETVTFPNPTDARVAAGGTWTSDAYDPYVDIMERVEFLAGKGYTVSRIFAPSTVRSMLSNNAKIAARIGRVSVAAGTAVGLPGRVSLNGLNALLGEDGVPPIELYDAQYETQTSTGFYLKRDVMVFVATTARDQSIDRGDQEPILLQNTIGYTGVGRPAGQSQSGRVLYTRSIPDSKPPRIEGEAWQTTFPVILDPEAIAVVTGIA